MKLSSLAKCEESGILEESVRDVGGEGGEGGWPMGKEAGWFYCNPRM